MEIFYMALIFVIGFMVGKTLTLFYVKTNRSGSIICDFREESPLLYLELTKDVEEVAKSTVVEFNVKVVKSR